MTVTRTDRTWTDFTSAEKAATNPPIMSVAKRIIPCLDVDQGRVVKGINFVDLVDAGDPVEQARFYDTAGADELVFLDITATHEGRDIMHEVVRRTADQVFIPLTVGGGLRTIEDIRAMLHAGADKVSVNSAALNDPELITRGAEAFGSQCIVVAIDAKRIADDPLHWEVYTHGGRKPTGHDALVWAVEAEVTALMKRSAWASSRVRMLSECSVLSCCMPTASTP